MLDPPDFESFRDSVLASVARGDTDRVLSEIRLVGRSLATEHGSEFRRLIGGLPFEIWHDDPWIAAAMGTSYRGAGAPRGESALGYYRAAEVAIAATPDAPDHCLAAVLVGHTAALRALGQLGSARAKSEIARRLIDASLAALPLRVTLDAQWALEDGMLLLHSGEFDQARRRLEYANGLAPTHLVRAEHVECLGALALLDLIGGDFDGAESHTQHARTIAEGTELLRTGYGAPALIAAMALACERGDSERAELLDDAVRTAASSTEFEPIALMASATLRALQERPIEALDLLNQAGRRLAGWDEKGVGLEIGELIRAGLLISLDQGDEAWTVLRKVAPRATHPLCPGRLVAQLRLRHGDLHGAEAAIRDCERLGYEHCARTLADIQLLRAAIELERGNLVTSDVNADRAFVSMARTGSRAPLGRIPASSLAAIAQRAAARPHRDAAAGLIVEIVERTSGPQREIAALSERERHVLAHVQRGLTVAAIAAELYISPNTVKTHLRNLYSKLGVSTREEAIRAARSLGLEHEITRDSPGSHRGRDGDVVL